MGDLWMRLTRKFGRCDARWCWRPERAVVSFDDGDTTVERHLCARCTELLMGPKLGPTFLALLHRPAATPKGGANADS